MAPHASPFRHAAKPPKLYKAAAKALRDGPAAAAATATAAAPRRHTDRLVEALVADALRYRKQLDRLFDQLDLFAAEPRLDPWLARVLFAELLLGRRTPSGESKPVQTVLRLYELHLDKFTAIKNQALDSAEKEAIRPRYVRVNSLKLSTADAVRNFQSEGWNLVRCTSGTYEDYLRQVENLGEGDFLPDYHVKVVFAFPPKTSFVDSSSYDSGEIFLQNKATCLAAHLLAPVPGSTVLDMCAAPGMKTTHLAAVMKNEGTIYSVEQDMPRSETLRQFIQTSGATCVKVINKDAAKVTKEDCPNVDYVLLDPSCSGSGISRIENNDREHDLQSGRLQKLSAFQAKLLRHALNEFRTAKRIVYSTCSLYPQENEEVVRDVLNNHKGKYKLVSAKGLLNNNWKNTGDPKYVDIGEKCLYARPDSDYTSGFFIAVFERDDAIVDREPNAINQIENDDVSHLVHLNDAKSKRKEKRYKVSTADVNADLISDEVKPIVENYEHLEDKPKRKERRYKVNTETVNVDFTPNLLESASNSMVKNMEEKPKKKEKRYKVGTDTLNLDLTYNTISKTMLNGDAPTLTNMEEKPSKKEKLVKVDIESLNTDLLPNEVTKTKKKKKKSKDNDESTASNLIDCDQSNNDLTLTNAEEKSKKKKKKKNNDLDISEETTSVSELNLKKNKKRKHDESNKFDEIKSVSDDVSTKKKKKIK